MNLVAAKITKWLALLGLLGLAFLCYAMGQRIRCYSISDPWLCIRRCFLVVWA